jgi:hypothetical protein
MKLTMNEDKRKLNININLLPKRYRGTVIQFKHVVVVLGALCAVFIILLFYQVVLDSFATTDLLRNGNDLITAKYELRIQEQQEQNLLQATINELNEINGKKDGLVQDIEFITTAASATNVEISTIKYSSATSIELQCLTDAYNKQPNYYQLTTETIDSFEESLIEYNGFLSVSHETIPSQVPEIIKVTITVNPNA